MEQISQILAWSGAILVYMKWINREAKWKYYRMTKSVFGFIACCLWLIFDVCLILSKGILSTTIILSVMNGIFFYILLRVLSEENQKKIGKMAMANVLLSSFTGSLLIQIYELVEYAHVRNDERLRNVLIVVCVIAFIAVQGVVLVLWKQYQNKQLDREKKISEAMSLQENMKFQEKQYQEMAEVYEEVKKLRHDMRNSYLLLQGLLIEGHVDEAKRFLEKENVELSKIPSVIQTDSVVISTLLNRSLQKARKQNIDISCKITTTFQGIDDRDLCHLLGNLLDNAIEAAVQATGENRMIDLVMQGSEHQLLIEIENSSIRAIPLQDGCIKTSKEDARNHGWGMKNVQAIVEKYGGNIVLENVPGKVKMVMILFRREEGLAW